METKIETSEKLAIRLKFAVITHIEKELKKFSNCDSVNDKKGYDKYFEIQSQLNNLLCDFLRTEFTHALTYKQFLHLCDLVSSHRPVQPFSFLVSISNRKK